MPRGDKAKGRVLHSRVRALKRAHEEATAAWRAAYAQKDLDLVAQWADAMSQTARAHSTAERELREYEESA
jgi:hypothetical protein